MAYAQHQRWHPGRRYRLLIIGGMKIAPLLAVPEGIGTLVGMFSAEQVISAASVVAKMAAIPLREPSTGRPTLWSPPLLITKTRPVPPGLGWIDYLTLVPGTGFAPVAHMAVVNRWIATGFNDPAVTGLMYRIRIDDRIVPANEFTMTAGIERNIDRNSLTPWPCQPQRCFFATDNGQRLTLQVNNPSAADEIAIAMLAGWYLPNLGNNPREAFEASGLDQDESVPQL